MQKTVPDIGGRSGVEIPSQRDYQSTADEKLDEALVNAIMAAETVGNEYLATVLTHELGSHYFENGI